MNPKARYACVIQILRTAKALWLASRRFFRPFGITEAQFNVLHILGNHPEGMSQRELSRLLVVDSSNVTFLIDRMQKRAWLQRMEVPHDRRAYRVCLTEAGRRFWERIHPSYRHAVQALPLRISVADMEATQRTLERIESRAAQWRSRETG